MPVPTVHLLITLRGPVWRVRILSGGTIRWKCYRAEDYPTPDGTCVRDYIHVKDLAEAHLLALEYLERGGSSDVFNLGNGAGYSVREIIETARRITGKEIKAVVEPRRGGDPSVLIASNKKAAEVLGWKPVLGLDQIISDAWAWHSGHPNGYEG